jgi:hypothetical protein
MKCNRGNRNNNNNMKCCRKDGITTYLNLLRFDGTAPEPRKGVRSGHIPGSKCVPFPDVCTIPMELKFTFRCSNGSLRYIEI